MDRGHTVGRPSGDGMDFGMEGHIFYPLRSLVSTNFPRRPRRALCELSTCASTAMTVNDPPLPRRSAIADSGGCLGGTSSLLPSLVATEILNLGPSSGLEDARGGLRARSERKKPSAASGINIDQGCEIRGKEGKRISFDADAKWIAVIRAAAAPLATLNTYSGSTFSKADINVGLDEPPYPRASGLSKFVPLPGVHSTFRTPRRPNSGPSSRPSNDAHYRNVPLTAVKKENSATSLPLSRGHEYCANLEGENAGRYKGKRLSSV
ncbi:hypothetical protein KM043_005495 [Ampulex compressa]|nr:hypothetical protein KM043_005495 [Ampulex compressa]